MNLIEYQEWTRETAVYPKHSLEARVTYCALGLGDETGEVLGKIKKWIRDGQDINLVRKELGDVLWYLARLADECDFSLQEIVDENVDKLTDRKKRDVLKGNGDER